MTIQYVDAHLSRGVYMESHAWSLLLLPGAANRNHRLMGNKSKQLNVRTTRTYR